MTWGRTASSSSSCTCQEDFGILVSEELDLYISQSVQSLSEVVMQKISEEAEQ